MHALTFSNALPAPTFPHRELRVGATAQFSSIGNANVPRAMTATHSCHLQRPQNETVLPDNITFCLTRPCGKKRQPTKWMQVKAIYSDHAAARKPAALSLVFQQKLEGRQRSEKGLSWKSKASGVPWGEAAGHRKLQVGREAFPGWSWVRSGREGIGEAAGQ